MIEQFRKISKKIIEEIAKKYDISSNLAFEIFSMALLFDLPYDTVVREIWTGDDPNDGGFDGVYIDEENDVVKLVQSKNVTSLKDNDLGKLRNNYSEIFVNGNKDKKPLSLEMQKFLEDYVDVTKKGVILHPELYFIYSGLNNDKKTMNEDVRKRFDSKRNGLPKITVLDFEYLYKRYLELQKKKRKVIDFTFNPVNSNIIDGQDLFSFAVDNLKAVSFRIKVDQLCKLIDEEVEKNGTMDFLFSDNIRGYLGNNATNKKIQEAILDKNKSKYFDLLNNGLTIVCDEVALPSSVQAGVCNVNIKNPVIVNGLQTSYVIYRAYKNKSLPDDIKVIIRVYEVRDQAIVDLITEATNTQSPINYRDKISNKEFNKYAKLFFEGENVLYISKRGELTENDISKGIQDSVTNQIVIKFWYATFYEKPHIAKNSVNQVMKDLFLASENKSLAKLFSGDEKSLVYSELFIAYKIYRFVTSKRLEYFKFKEKRRGRLNDFLLHSDEIISYGVYKELSKNKKINRFSQDDLEEAYKVALKNVKKIIPVELKRQGESYAHTVYFKSERCLNDYNDIV